MPTPPIPQERQELYKRTIEAALVDGFTPIGQSGGRGSAVSEAARRLEETGQDTGTQRAIGRKIQGWIATQRRHQVRGNDYLLPDWGLYRDPGQPVSGLSTGGVRKIDRWILTAAQDDTDVHERFLANLRAYAHYIGARLVIAGWTYNKALYSDHDTATATYRPSIREHMTLGAYDCGPVLFAADVNILPTAGDPLSDLQSYGRGRTAIFGHAKHRFLTVPSMPGGAPIYAMTTGAVTLPNYIPKKAGKKAEFHHVVGAIVLEVTSDGVFPRQIAAEGDGTFQDLDHIVENGVVRSNQRVRAITFGDIHAPYFDPNLVAYLWGRDPESMIEALRPRHVVAHDLTDFRPINRHSGDDPIHKTQMLVKAEHVVEEHVRLSAQVVRDMQRDSCQVVIPVANHHDWLMRWVKSPAGHADPVNRNYWHRLNLALDESVRAGDDDFDLYKHALCAADPDSMRGVEFVPRNGSFVICQEKSGGVDIGQHGHQGPNGARATIRNLARINRRTVLGHGHELQMFEGASMAGMTGLLDQGYNPGPSTWSHGHIVTYDNGKRTVVTQLPDGRWRA